MVLGLLIASLFICPAVGEAASYDALLQALPDGRVVSAADLVLERDAFRIEFTQGLLHLLAPVAGRAPGAVFVGQGQLTVAPASEVERAHMARLTGDTSMQGLIEPFSGAFLLLDDDTEAEILQRIAALRFVIDLFEQHARSPSRPRLEHRSMV